MTITYIGDGTYRGLSTDTKPTSGIATNAIFIETDTRRTFLFDGATTWNQPESFNDPYTWFIYKQSSNYKAKSGYLGYAPSGAISTSLNTVWSYIKNNFIQGGAPDTTRAGSIVFSKGTFTFATAPEAIDPTWNGSATAGYVIAGQGHLATLIDFTNGSVQDAGFEIKDMQYSTIRDLWIRVNANITNAIKITATAGSPENNRIRHLVINKDTTPVVGQRGVYILTNNGTAWSSFFNKITDVHFLRMHTGIETAGASINKNAYTIDSCTFWDAEYGIILAPGSIQHNISNIGWQCGATYGKYGVSLGTVAGGGASYSNVTNVWGDNLTQAGSAIVVLHARASRNNISNITLWASSTGHACLDYSGNHSNQFTNVVGLGVPNNKGRARFGRWQASTHIAASGLLDGLLVPNTTDNVAGVPIIDTTEGRHIRFLPASSANSVSGIRGDQRIVTRAMQPVLYIRFSGNSTNTRMFVGLTNSVSDPPLDNAYQTATACIALRIPYVANTAQNFTVLYNDSTGSANATNVLDTSGAAIPADVDVVHDLMIIGDNVNSRWLFSLDGHTPMIFTSEIPGANDELTLFATSQFTLTSGKQLRLYDIELRTMT